MRRIAFSGLVTLLALTLAGAVSYRDGPGGSAPKPPSLTVYSGNLALVRREVDRPLGPGEHTVRIDGLPTNIEPASLMVLNAGVTLLGTHGFRSYQDAAAGPGASVDLDLDVVGRLERLELAFLTSGLSWSADYTVVIARDDATARFNGYASITNGSGTSYEAAEVQLLAGTIQRGQARPYAADELRASRVMMEAAAAPGLGEAAFGGYHLYTVSTPLSLRAGESRRIRLLGADSARTLKEYIFSYGVDYYRQYPEPVTTPVAMSYRVKRPESSELGGVPLPAGQVRMLQRDDAGRVQLLGIASIGNTPAEEDIRLNVGYAFDIIGTRTQTEYRRPSGNVYESGWKVVLKNKSDSDVIVQVIERVSGDWRILESSHSWEKLSAGAVLFPIEVPAGGEATLEYQLQVRS